MVVLCVFIFNCVHCMTYIHTLVFTEMQAALVIQIYKLHNIRKIIDIVIVFGQSVLKLRIVAYEFRFFCSTIDTYSTCDYVYRDKTKVEATLLFVNCEEYVFF